MAPLSQLVMNLRWSWHAETRDLFEALDPELWRTCNGDPVKVLTDLLKERDDISALVLAAAKEGGPGPLVSHFAGSVAGSLPCPLIIVPGGLDDEQLARLT